MATGKLLAVVPPLPITFSELKDELCQMYPFLNTVEGWKPTFSSFSWVHRLHQIFLELIDRKAGLFSEIEVWLFPLLLPPFILMS